MPAKFRPAESFGNAYIQMTARNNSKINGYAIQLIMPDGSMNVVASISHNEWYGTSVWITDQPA